jgi:energy-coupling factor transporter ATP-binding protein EcfA2
MDHINTNASFDVGDDNNCSQMPALPPLSKEDLIKQQLTILAESQPSPIAVDLALKKLSDEHDVGIRALRQTYEIIVKSLLRDAVAPSGELSDDAKAEKERQAQVDAEWQALVDERADEIANTANIPKELCAGLRDYCGYIASPHAAATLAITHAARLLPKSMGFVISGPSGSGKSGLVEMGALFLPPECVIRLTSVSDKALYYLGGIAHKYWLGGELRVLKIGEDDPAQQVLRQLISENRISRMIVEKDDDGKMCTVVHYTEGPAVFVMTTTSEFTAFHDEFVNRLSWIQTSDEAELTGDVLNAQAAAVAKVQDAHWKDRCELELKAWQEFHRRLKPYNVIIPFANEIVPK